MKKLLFFILIITIILYYCNNQIKNILNTVLNKFKKDEYEITINGHKYNENVYDIFKFDNKWVVTIREKRINKEKEKEKAKNFEKWCKHKCVFIKKSEKKLKNSHLETYFILN
jgi:YbbR domain-containing protein